MLLTSLSLSLMRYYASFVGLLLHDQVSSSQRRTAMIQSLIAPALYALALVLAFVWKPGTIILQIVVSLVFFLASPGAHGQSLEASE